MNEEEQTSDIATESNCTTGSNGDMTKKEETNDRHEHDVVSARAGGTGRTASPSPRPSSSKDGADQSGFRIVDGLAPPPLPASLARLLCLGAFVTSTPTTASTSTVRPQRPLLFFLFVTLWVVPRLHRCLPLLLLSCG
jgi:hypothetical protein